MSHDDLIKLLKAHAQQTDAAQKRADDLRDERDKLVVIALKQGLSERAVALAIGRQKGAIHPIKKRVEGRARITSSGREQA